jgi:hypothetical protein
VESGKAQDLDVLARERRRLGKEIAHRDTALADPRLLEQHHRAEPRLERGIVQ